MSQDGGSPGRSSGGASPANIVKRVMNELEDMKRSPSPLWYARPISDDDPREWHFTMRGPRDSDFAGGIYHGRILLPDEYPLKPPSVIFLTSNGRFEVGKKVCLSASNFHPELWQPAWGLSTMLTAIHAFLPSPGEGAVHALDYSPEVSEWGSETFLGWEGVVGGGV
eukprot:GHVU01118105.1.p1 GENE.GHVU01118105.1~~GHVU01118105.1.p1  ORF type:complete len:176 (-),score=5.14 GHVU01118105.1:379-879(-)